MGDSCVLDFWPSTWKYWTKNLSPMGCICIIYETKISKGVKDYICMLYIYICIYRAIFLSQVNIWYDNCARETDILENVSTWGGLEPPASGSMPNALTCWAIRARHLLSHVFEHWLWWYRYFWSKVNIWCVNCARETAFIFVTWTGILVNVSKSEFPIRAMPDGIVTITPTGWY